MAEHERRRGRGEPAWWDPPGRVPLTRERAVTAVYAALGALVRLLGLALGVVLGMVLAVVLMGLAQWIGLLP